MWKEAEVLEFGSEFGDLNPIDGLRGPKMPSRRQVLHHFLFFITLGCSLVEAADKVVPNILKHSTETAKNRYKLRDDVSNLYRAVRC